VTIFLRQFDHLLAYMCTKFY